MEEFDKSLEGLKIMWDSREKPYAPSSGPRFFHYFVQYQADVVRYHMRKDIRESVGLGSPPSAFNTNASESINAAIKRKVNYKESGWPEFNGSMEHFVDSQKEELGPCLVVENFDFVLNLPIMEYLLHFGSK